MPATLTVRVAVLPACGGLLSWKWKVTLASPSLAASAVTLTVVVSGVSSTVAVAVAPLRSVPSKLPPSTLVTVAVRVLPSL
ncbi:hypothetical protein D3C77_645830 [compost metagenome]